MTGFVQHYLIIYRYHLSDYALAWAKVGKIIVFGSIKMAGHYERVG